MKISFVAESVYSMFYRKDREERIGGAELQQKLIGEGLRDRGYDVSFVSADCGQADRLVIDDITFLRASNPSRGIKGVRFFYPRLYKLYEACLRADADVYYCRCAGYLPGLLAIFCRLHHKKFIFAGAHDTDFMPDKLLIQYKRDRALYLYGLKRADAVFVQSQYQKRLLSEQLGLDGVVIRNLSSLPPRILPLDDRRIVLWVGKINLVKRPMHFVRLARAFPDQEFVMIGGTPKGCQSLEERVREACRAVPNLSFLGFQPLEKVEKYFDRCKLLVNTSEYEGFPNTFLQAWSRGAPVLSYVDPDGVIKRYALGASVNTESGMKLAIGDMLKNTDRGFEGIVEYYERNHSLRVIDQYHEILHGLCGGE